MGKRSNFPRRSQDAYDTPYEAVIPLLPFLPLRARYIEPCAGNASLISHLARHGHTCEYAYDVAPRAHGIEKRDIIFDRIDHGSLFITNPPWTRELMHPIIDLLSEQSPTWLLFDADWMHTKQARPFKKFCKKIVSIGRVSWMQNGKGGMDNCCWYLFSRARGETKFYFRG